MNEKTVVTSKQGPSSKEKSVSPASFIADVSRGIRTPMGVIMGFVELLKAGNISEEDRKESLEKITKNCNVILRLIDEITEVSDIESDHFAINFKKVDLESFIDSIKADLEDKVKEKKLRFQFKTKDLPKYIYTDPERLKEVLINVIDNSVKYTKKGYIIVHVVGKIRDYNSTIEFNIIDSGIGISRDHQKTIFREFTNKDKTSNHETGIGLGLYLSKKIVQSLNGSLDLIKSTEGKGSTFRIQLHSHVPSREKFVTQDYVLDPSKEDQPLDGLTLLVIDDSFDNCIYLRKILNTLGANVAVSYEGKRGAERALKGSFDTVLLDLQMPNTDGFETLRLLQSQEYKQPVIALTASATTDDKNKCLSAGFSEFLTKPINIPALIQAILSTQKE